MGNLLERAHYQKVQPIIVAGIVAMCFIPALLFVWRGTFSRLHNDDWLHLADAREMSVFEAVLMHRNDTPYTGAYSAIAIKTLYGLLGPQGLRLFPAVVLVSLIAAGTILMSLALRLFKGKRWRWWIALMANALLASAFASAIYNPQALFWYSASIRYSLSIVFTLLLLSLLLHIHQTPNKRSSTPWALACAALAFWTAGFSETYTITLALALSVLLASVALAGGEWRKRLGYPLTWSWLATGLGGLTMLTAPSIAGRAGERFQKSASFWHEFPEMIWASLLDRFGDPDVQLAFALMVAVGILVGFALPRPALMPETRDSRKRTANCWLFGLLCQLLFLPLLLSHTSYEPVILGRFSIKYAAAIALNALLLAMFALALRSRWRSKTAPLLLLAGALGMSLALHFLHVNLRVEMYLWVSLHCLLLMTTWQLSLRRAGTALKRFAAGMGAFYLTAGLCLLWMASITALSYSHGSGRSYTAFVFMLCWCGLGWGIYIGWAWPGIWTQGIKAVAMLMILYITVTIATGVIAEVAVQRPYTELFDKIDAEITAKRKAGERHILIETPILCCKSRLETQFKYPFTNRYYGVDSIEFGSA